MILKKVSHEKNFTVICNGLLQNRSLSYEAKGLLLELLSRPQNWVIKKEFLKREGCGQTKIDRIIKELKDAGYLYCSTFRSDDGRIIDRTWTVSEEPLSEEEWKNIDYPNDGKPMVRLTTPQAYNNILNNIGSTSSLKTQNTETDTNPSTPPFPSTKNVSNLEKWDWEQADLWMERAKTHFSTVKTDRTEFAEALYDLRTKNGVSKENLERIYSYLRDPPNFAGFHWFDKIQTPKKLRKRSKSTDELYYALVLRAIDDERKNRNTSHPRSKGSKRPLPTYKPERTGPTHL